MKYALYLLAISAIVFGVTYAGTVNSFFKAKKYVGETVVYKFNSHLFSPRVTVKVLNVTHDLFQTYVQVKIMDGEYNGAVTQITFQDLSEHLL